MERLLQDGFFSSPNLWTLYEVVRYAVELECGRVLVDLWNFDDLVSCEHCKVDLRQAFESINQHQALPQVECGCHNEWDELLTNDHIRSYQEYRSFYADMPWMRTRE